MKLTFLNHNIIKLVSQRNHLILLVGLLALSNLLLSIMALGKREQIILVPPHISKSLKIQGDVVSKEYLEELGIHMAKLLLDLSPSSFPYNHQLLLKYISPEAYGVLKKRLLKDGEHYTKMRLATHFSPSQVIADPKTLRVEISGVLTSFISDHQVQSAQEKVVFEFTKAGAGLLIKKITGRVSLEGESLEQESLEQGSPGGGYHE